MEFAIGLIALAVAIIGFPMLYERLRSLAALSLLKKYKCESLPNPIYDGERTYWLINLRLGKGNWACRIMKSLVSMDITTQVRFESLANDNGDRYTSSAYEVNLGIRNRRIVYPIRPEAEIKLAVFQSYPDLSLRTFGDSFGYSELTGSYRLILSFGDKWNNEIGRRCVIEPYIVDGNPISNVAEFDAT